MEDIFGSYSNDVGTGRVPVGDSGQFRAEGLVGVDCSRQISDFPNFSSINEKLFYN